MDTKQYHSVPVLFDGVELKKGLKIYRAHIEYQDEAIHEAKFTITENTFNEFWDWNKAIKDITEVSIHNHVRCDMDVGRLEISQIKYCATTKKGALEGYKQSKIDDLMKSHNKRMKCVDEDLKWAFERAKELELDIQKERLELLTKITQIDMEIAKH